MTFTLDILSDLAFYMGCYMILRLTANHILFLTVMWSDNKRSMLYGSTKSERLVFYRRIYRKEISPDLILKLSTSHAEECAKEFHKLKKTDELLLKKIAELRSLMEAQKPNAATNPPTEPEKT